MASVQDVVKTITRQANLEYDLKKSLDQTDPQCREWVRDVRIDAVPFDEALRQILEPVGLRYEVANGAIVPSRAEKLVSYAGGRASVQDIVMDVAKQAGLEYDFEKSFSQTNPRIKSW